MKMRSVLVVCVFAGCSSGSGKGSDFAADAVSGDQAAEAAEGVAGETATEVVEDSEVPADTAEAQQMQTRHFTFRAIGGMSMGAQAMTVAVHHPDQFDFFGAMGGYIDYRYMGHVIRDELLGGFCPMDQILANIASIDDPTVLNCGPVPPAEPYEWPWSFDDMHYNDNGGHWQRTFYLDVLGSLTYAFGNMITYNPDNPLLPIGVPYDWMKNQTDKCNNPYVVDKASGKNYNAEYNPDGTYDLITFCDDDPPAPGGIDRDTCSADPTCRAELGIYDPTQTHTHEVHILLAVDYNGNGKRDWGEPVVVNAMERYKDVGKDGCADEFEDGNGGCLTTARTDGAKDPNGDNFDLDKNPLGTEGNFEYDEGEPYDDNGLDGVPDTGDYGEGDGKFTVNPNYQTLVDQDARTYIMNASAADLRAKTWYFEGGIRDALHAITSMEHLVAHFTARGEEVHAYDDFARTANALVPNANINALVTTLEDVDYSPAKYGRNQLMRYGDPNATQAEILSGDGGHVGAGAEVVLRVMNYFAYATHRMPDVEQGVDHSDSRVDWSSYHSDALNGRRWFVAAVPPGYDEPANAAKTYPVLILLPGIGMPLDSMADTMALIEPMMSAGVLPKAIVLLPDGQCAYRRYSDGQRLTGCVRSQTGNGYDCVDDTCTGPHASCTVTQGVDGSTMTQECNSGHFFVNHKTNIWGEPDVASVMRYEDSLIELINFIDQNYRTRPAGDFQVPADW